MLAGLTRALVPAGLRASLMQFQRSGTQQGLAPSVSDFQAYADASAPRQPPPEPSQLSVIDVLPDGNCLFNAIAVSKALNVPTGARLLSTTEVRREARQLRLAANDFLCPRGVPSKDEVGGLPLELVMEPRGAEGGRGYCARLR